MSRDHPLGIKALASLLVLGKQAAGSVRLHLRNPRNDMRAFREFQRMKPQPREVTHGIRTTPHQGKKEIERRRRQIAAGKLRADE